MKSRILVAVKHPAVKLMREALGRRFEVVKKPPDVRGLTKEMSGDYDAVVVSHWLPVTGKMIRNAFPASRPWSLPAWASTT